MMNKKLPSIFKNTDHSIVNNNKKIFYSNFEDRGIGNRIIDNNANNAKDIKDEYLFLLDYIKASQNFRIEE